MLDFFYSLPSWFIIVLIFMLCFVWGILSHIYIKKTKYSNRRWHQINIVIFIISIVLIVRYTIYGREYWHQELNLRPFSFLFEEYRKEEFLKEMILNVLLFIPFGLSLYVIVRGDLSKKMFITVILAILLSTLIEILQYNFKVGWTEVDDIICNVFGAVIGSFSMLVKDIIEKESS